MKALISPIEPVCTGYRVVQVCDEFPVAEPYFWVDAPSGVDLLYAFYNPSTSAVETRTDVIPPTKPEAVTQGLGTV